MPSEDTKTILILTEQEIKDIGYKVSRLPVPIQRQLLNLAIKENPSLALQPSYIELDAYLKQRESQEN